MIVQSLILAAWIVANVMAWVHHWDPYPFILLNLALSFQAAYATPIIMMSQNRQAAKDRLMAEQDYLVNTKAEEEVKAIMHHLEQQDEAMIDILQRMEQHHAIISGFAAMGLTAAGLPRLPEPANEGQRLRVRRICLTKCPASSILNKRALNNAS
jgi:uncharacterized membrane protein